MKKILLSQQDNAIGYNNPDNVKYFADSKRISRKEFDAIKQSASKLECLDSYQVNGVRNFDIIAIFEN